ncbi:MAG: PSD1 domain-containing protein [Planctomycetales bacterium]|nr:PSD1 domain-containing protein [Planctomycetales bacterium]
MNISCMRYFLWISCISASFSQGGEIRFARDVLPILSDNCFKCHGPDEAQRQVDLRLDVAEDALRTDSPVILPGNSSESELILRVLTKDEDQRMPPIDSRLQLTERQRAILTQWVDEGAHWQEHWAFTPPVQPCPPVIDSTWTRNPIDSFVLQKMAENGLSPLPEAERFRLLRRVTFDLTGLPPTADQICEFVNDTEPNAYLRVVDRLLMSPEYGQRMAWDWLEVARYADTNGYQGDQTRTMWPWRDWVVNAYNNNMPFDQFTIQQLAGDLLPSATAEQIVATGFNRNHMINGEGGRIAEENRVEYIFDQIETVATAWLGLTLTCSRCHDHKYDPIRQEDYYGLFAIFNNTPVTGRGGSGQTEPTIALASADQQLKINQLLDEIERIAELLDALELELFPRETGKQPLESTILASFDKPLIAGLEIPAQKRSLEMLNSLVKEYQGPDTTYRPLLKQLIAAKEIRDALDKSIPRVMVMQESAARETHILIRGAYDNLGASVQPSTIRFMHPSRHNGSMDRLALANWIVDASNPLTSRVTVNRIWQMFFGIGLVSTAQDFGVQGQSPSHAELLDWLAVDFQRSGWDVKRLVKQIVTSATYRQSADAGEAAYQSDPENRLLARGPRFRLPAWMIRDQALAISGLLSSPLGGPAVNPYQPEGIWAEATFDKIKYERDVGEGLYRRSIHTFWRRIVGPTLFFDAAKRQTCEVKPLRTNTPLHALVTLNDDTFLEAARITAQRVLASHATQEERIRTIFTSTTGREPSLSEMKVLSKQLDQLEDSYRDDPKAAAELLAIGDAPSDININQIELAAYTCICNLALNLDEVLSK